MSDKAYQIYSGALSAFPECDVREVVEKIAKMRRREGEKAFPALGDLIEPLRNMAEKRQREQAERKQQESKMAHFWSWVDEQVANTGQSEQEVLDSIRVPGYVGLKARR